MIHTVTTPEGIGSLDEEGKFTPSDHFRAYCLGVSIGRTRNPLEGKILRGLTLMSGCIRVKANDEEIIQWSNWSLVIFFDHNGNATRCVQGHMSGHQKWQTVHTNFREIQVEKHVLGSKYPHTDTDLRMQFRRIPE